MTTPTRQRMIEAAADLIRSRGLHDTSFTEVLARSGATRGTIYHHFPDGKQQLAREAIGLTKEQALGSFRTFDRASPENYIQDFVSLMKTIALSEQGPGCAVGAVVQDAGTVDDDLRAASDDVFAAWRSELTEGLISSGADPTRAAALAVLMLATLEGAHLLCRASRSTAPLDAIAVSLTDAAEAARRPSAT